MHGCALTDSHNEYQRPCQRDVGGGSAHVRLIPLPAIDRRQHMLELRVRVRTKHGDGGIMHGSEADDWQRRYEQHLERIVQHEARKHLHMESEENLELTSMQSMGNA